MYLPPISSFDRDLNSNDVLDKETCTRIIRKYLKHKGDSRPQFSYRYKYTCINMFIRKL